MFILQGLLAGFLATVPMSLFMWLAHRFPVKEREPLPPHQITMNLAEKAEVRGQLSTKEKYSLTTAAHFAFGAAAGGVYALLARWLVPPSPVTGVGYGLFVWGINYAGVLPKMRLVPSAFDSSYRRNFLMITAHVIWGAALGLLTGSFR